MLLIDGWVPPDTYISDEGCKVHILQYSIAVVQLDDLIAFRSGKIMVIGAIINAVKTLLGILSREVVEEYRLDTVFGEGDC